MSLDDPTGQQLLAERIRLARESSVEYLCNLPVVEPLPASEWPLRIFTSGVGSGEGHARFLAFLINRYSPHIATFVPVSEAEVTLRRAERRNDRLVVFSQGLSPQSQIVIKAWPNKPRMVLCTAATPEALFADGKDSRGTLLRQLLHEGVRILNMPMRGESTVFLQVVGPMCGYLAAIHWARKAAGAEIPPIEPEALENALLQVASVRKKVDWDDILYELQRVDEIWVSGALASYADNLALKFSKGIFRRLPTIKEIFALADGPFQSAFKKPRTQWILGLPDPRSQELTLRARNMLSQASVPARVWLSPLPEPYAVLYYEQLFNFLLLNVVTRQKLDQENWPGKGMDGALYELAEPSQGSRAPF
jgi:hypothetical protein